MQAAALRIIEPDGGHCHPMSIGVGGRDHNQ